MAIDDTLEHPQGGGEEQLYPQTAELSDLYGSPIYEESDPEITDYGEEGGESVIDLGNLAGPGLSTYLTHGLYNADFRIPPANPFASLEPANPLPYWRPVKAAGNIEIVYTSEGWVHFVIPASTVVDDESYIEQIVPISATGEPMWLWLDERAVLVSDGNLERYMRIQYYDEDGVADGAEKEYARTFSIAVSNYTDDPNVWGVPSSSARFARVRVGVKATGSASQDNDYKVERIWRKDTGALLSANYFGQHGSIAGTSTVNLYVGTNATANNARLWIPAYDGWVIGVGARSQSSRTAGNATIYAYNSTAGGKVADYINPRLDLAAPTKVWEAGDPGADGSKFLGGDQMRGQMVTSGWTPTSSDLGWNVQVLLDPAAGSVNP